MANAIFGHSAQAYIIDVYKSLFHSIVTEYTSSLHFMAAVAVIVGERDKERERERASQRQIR